MEAEGFFSVVRAYGAHVCSRWSLCTVVGSFNDCLQVGEGFSKLTGGAGDNRMIVPGYGLSKCKCMSPRVCSLSLLLDPGRRCMDRRYVV